jgi:hypothetical protein
MTRRGLVRKARDLALGGPVFQSHRGLAAVPGQRDAGRAGPGRPGGRLAADPRDAQITRLQNEKAGLEHRRRRRRAGRYRPSRGRRPRLDQDARGLPRRGELHRGPRGPAGQRQGRPHRLAQARPKGPGHQHPKPARPSPRPSPPSWSVTIPTCTTSRSAPTAAPPSSTPPAATCSGFPAPASTADTRG